MKLILATILAGSFLFSLPLRAEETPSGDSKSEKGKKNKSDKKSGKKSGQDKGADEGAKPSGGGW